MASTRSGHNRPLGQVLVDSGLVSPMDVQQALTRQARDGGPLSAHLVLMGVVTEEQVYASLARQMGLPFVNLIDDPPDPRLEPPDMADEAWIPYQRRGTTLVIATCEPPNRRMIQQALLRYAASSRRVEVVIVTRSQFGDALGRDLALPEWTALDSNQ